MGAAVITEIKAPALDDVERIDGNNSPRAALLLEAKKIVTQDREAEHGKAEDNFATIAKLWDAYLESRDNNGASNGLGAVDVAAMMILLKVARISSNPNSRDNWLDTAGYAACGWGIQSPEV